MFFDRWKALSGRGKVVLTCLFLALVTLALYWPVTGFGFVNFDDNKYVTDNPWVQNGFTCRSIIWAFTTHHASNWHPVTWLSHILDCQIYGLHPGGHHFTNVLFHIANTLLLFGLLRRLTGAVGRSAFVAALFAWHPLHVESVAWISERKDVLSTFFALLALWAYWLYGKCPNWRRYGLVLLCFALGLMAKPMLVTLPLLMLLLDYWPLGKIKRTGEHGQSTIHHWSWLVWEKFPFFILSGASCWITLRIQVWGQGQISSNLSLVERVENALDSYLRYIGKLAWPEDLSIYYPYPHHLPFWHAAAAAMVLVAISIWVCSRAHRQPHLVVGWFWFLIALVPVIGLVQVGGQAMADRYAYIPSIGFFVVLTWEAYRLIGPVRHSKWILATVATVVLVACLAVTSRQLRYWRNSVTLFSHALAVTHNNAVAQCNLGEALSVEGKPQEALMHLDEALKLQPRSPLVLNDKGEILYDQGENEAAASEFKAALALRPDFAPAHENLGKVLLALGKPEEAETQFRTAVKYDPVSSVNHVNLGLCLAQERQLHDAIAQYQAALKLTPDCNAENAWGSALESEGQLDQAIEHYRKALKINPDYADAQCNLGAILTDQGKYDEAIQLLQSALKSKPDFAEAHYNLGNALIGKGQTYEAALQYAEAVRLKPDYMEAHFNLGNVFFQQKQWSRALEQFAVAARLQPNFAGTQIRMAMVWEHMGNGRKAATHYRAALRIEPQSIISLQGLAWILATDPDPTVRNGTEAVHLALTAVKQGTNPSVWDTLAAAYAEVGQFSEALSASQKAINLAKDDGYTNMVVGMEVRMQLYEQNRPFHELK